MTVFVFVLFGEIYFICGLAGFRGQYCGMKPFGAQV